MMFEVCRYSSERKGEWNDFVARSKNGTFLLNRDYMDYHSDRFCDYSLMFYLKGELYALLPANVKDSMLVSHGGLTYGGLVMDENATCANVVVLFEELNVYLKVNGITCVRYKAIPHIYHKLPSEEDVYGIFRTCDAKLVGRDISSVIINTNRPKFKELRRRGVKKALRNGLVTEESSEWKKFWEILSNNLNDKYGVKPVHSLSEITMLAGRFSSNIRLFVTRKENIVLGGVVVFLAGDTVHIQYISASPEGKALGALDLLFDMLINDVFSDYRFFDFGKSTEDCGKFLNESLIHQKEGFGGRGVCYDVYEWGI